MTNRSSVVLVLSLFALMVSAKAAPQATKSDTSVKEAQKKWVSADYIRWLEEQSLLYQAERLAPRISGKAFQWRRPYAEPQPDEVVKKAPVWLLDYPGSVITRPGESVIGTWANPQLWEVLKDIGIAALHTGPVKQAGGIRQKEHTPTIDGWFDRISLKIDPQLGTEDDYRRMVKSAAKHGGVIAGDLVPLHTGLGADFRLAQRRYKNYAGLYTMVEINKEDWDLLPKVDGPWDIVLVSKETAVKLLARGYIPGLINSNDAALEARQWSGWSATGEILGVDGKVRRSVFLHFFKPGQPTLNWLDPSNAAQRAVAGDVVRTLYDLGGQIVRLDAVPFLGIERQPGMSLSLHFQHPLSVMGTNYLAFFTRKMGGWSFQELNVPLVQLKKFTKHGPDLSYNFFTRTESIHSLLVGDAALLRLGYGFLLEQEIPLGTLVHDLQNHDEITYQLVELDFRGDETFTFQGKKITGRQLREQVLQTMREKAAGKSTPYNLLYRPQKDGVATTFAGFIAAAHDIRDPYSMKPEQVEQVKRDHLLLTWANAMQPGVFSLSSWDLVGALPLKRELVEERMEDGDYRWVNRGGVDLMGLNPKAEKSAWGLPRAKTLYGPLPEQLKDSKSFVSQLKKMLAARKKYRLAEGELLGVAEVKNSAVCVLVMKLPGKHSLGITALNFGREAVSEELDLTRIKEVEKERVLNRELIDILSGKGAGKISDPKRVKLQINPRSGKTLVIGENAEE